MFNLEIEFQIPEGLGLVRVNGAARIALPPLSLERARKVRRWHHPLEKP